MTETPTPEATETPTATPTATPVPEELPEEEEIPEETDPDLQEDEDTTIHISDGDTVTWSISADGTVLTIGGEGDMWDFFSFCEEEVPWYPYRDTVTTLNLGGSVTHIGDCAFGDYGLVSFPNLTRVNLGYVFGTKLTDDEEKESYIKNKKYLKDFNAYLTASDVDYYGLIGCYNSTLYNATWYFYIFDGSLHAAKPYSSNSSYTSDDKTISIWWNLDDSGYIEIGGTGKVSAGITSLSRLPDSVTVAVIDDGITELGEKLFYNANLLTSVTIADSVTAIGKFAFASCPALTQVTLPSGLTRLEEHTFAYCTALESIQLPSTLTYLGMEAFTGCTALKSIDLPDGITSLSSGTFFGCTSLTTVDLPSSLKTVGQDAFNGCTALTEVTIPSGTTTIESAAFANCSALATITVPDSVTSIGGNAWPGGSDVTVVCSLGSAAHRYAAERGNSVILTLNSQAKASTFSAGYTYTGSSIEPAVSLLVDVNCDGQPITLTEGTDYCLSYENNINVGTATVFITGIGRYNGQIKTTFAITRAANTVKTGKTAYSYNGSTKDRTFNLGAGCYGGAKLTYSSNNSSNISVDASGNVTIKAGYIGTATITVKAAACSNYLAAKTTVTVTSNYIKNTITLTTAKYIKNGSNKVRTFSIGATAKGKAKLTYASDNAKILVDTSGEVTIPAGFIGTANITVTAAKTGIYKKTTVTVPITVSRISNTITASNITRYTGIGVIRIPVGATCLGDATMTYTSDNSKITVSSAGQITIPKNFVGKATITITAAKKGIYKKTTRSITLTVKPLKTNILKMTNKSGLKLKLTWEGVTSAGGYDLQYATNSSFTDAQTISITDKTTTVYTITGLKKGKTYYVRVRTWKKVSGIVYRSGWSGVQSLKITQ